MPPDPSIERLLRLAACVDLDPGTSEGIRQACLEQRDWNETIRQAELHGLAPYLLMRVEGAGGEIPARHRKKLKALTFRHSRSSRIRTRALLEILRCFEQRGIDALVLKGAALAHLIYDEPGLRPMRDIDLLVASDRLADAARAASELGYEDAGSGNSLSDHHHLPTVSRTSGGLRVSLEIHHDALTRDNIGSIRLDNLSEPAREFTMDGGTARTLGHIDTLRHLCRHALEPGETTKIGSALDIMTYASRHAGGLDWPRLRKDYPEVVTMLQLLGYLVPWPSNLSPHVPEPPADPPSGVGAGPLPLSMVRHGRRRAAKLLNPSDWWLRCFYNVPPGKSLLYTKLLRHPTRVLFWLWRRLGKAFA